MPIPIPLEFSAVLASGARNPHVFCIHSGCSPLAALPKTQVERVYKFRLMLASRCCQHSGPRTSKDF